jgi:uncharacterized membrane protein YbhN (UPF0104 family)
MDVMFQRIPWRPIFAIGIILLTAGFFANYITDHPELRQQLTDIPLVLLIALLGLYVGFIGSLALINNASLRLCKKTIPAGESLLLTMYSSVINFFGPLQSGPAFRALYLKQKHSVKIKDYTAASMVYYGFYAMFSLALLLSSTLRIWLLLPLIIGLCGVVFIGRGRLSSFKAFRQLELGSWYAMAIATLLQIGILVTIFFVELRAIDSSIQLSQVLVYTGAANLALFVSITPGAIGFRESFLLLSENFHGIDPTTIIAANLIDRSVYIVLLLILAAGIFGTHARRRFQSISKS